MGEESAVALEAAAAAEHRIGRLRRDSRGYPVPWFVAWIDGAPDFRIIRRRGIPDAVRLGLCWICGGVIGSRYQAFTIGPMGAINRISAEPPSHRECSIYAATHCPFLVKPAQRRRSGELPEDALEPAGMMIERNPGVALVWVTRRWSMVGDGAGGVLFDVGEPVETRWYAHGREATREEVLESIDSGLPLLRQAAEQDGPKAIDALERQRVLALRFLPAPSPFVPA